MDEGNVYGSGLNSEDWAVLRDTLWPFLHPRDPKQVKLPRGLPAHLRNHPLIRHLRKYRETGDSKYLDRAGQLLIPTTEPFGWYVPLTK